MKEIYNNLYTIDFFSSNTFLLDLPYSIYDWVLAEMYQKYWPDIKK